MTMVQRLLTAREQLNLRTHEAREGISTRDAHLAWHRAWAAREDKRVPHPDAVGAIAEDAAAAVAYVNHGRWVADCPASSCARCKRPCGAALNLLPESLFWCPCCHNAELGGRWRPVQWPAPADKRRVEAALVVRTEAVERNWEPARQTPDELLEETRAMLTAAAGEGDVSAPAAEGAA